MILLSYILIISIIASKIISARCTILDNSQINLFHITMKNRQQNSIYNNLANKSFNLHYQERKPTFLSRNIKKSLVSKPPPLKVKHPIDFYSMQRVAVRKRETKEKTQANISSSSDFYRRTRLSNRKIQFIQPQRQSLITTKRQLPNIFKNKNSLERSPSSSSIVSSSSKGRATTLSFHRQNIDENKDNYLNKYQILKQLGRGSCSIVFLARAREFSNAFNINSSIDQADQKKEVTESKQENTLTPFDPIEKLLAIKVYEKFKVNKDIHKFKNIRKQINIMQNLDNPGILKFYESIESLTKISLIVEYCGQQSLLDYLKLNFPLSQQKIMDISKQLISTISYLHDKNIVHRDIKLQNILIKQDKIKLIDFGFSCISNHQSIIVHKNQHLTSICGTPNYMAPQVISRKQYDGQAADIWSYGVVVYILSQGKHPFKALNYNDLERTINRGKFQFNRTKSSSLIELIRRIFRLRPHERPNAKDILQLKWFKQNILG